MTNITAEEKGRKLVLTVGDDADSIIITVNPINAALGSALYALYAGIAFAATEHPEVDAESMAKLALGEENWPVVENDLRSAEAKDVVNSAIFWNVQGGGIDVVNELLTGGGLPKARDLLLEANGHSTISEQLQTLLNGASVNPTPSPAATPTTPTRSGSGTSFRAPGRPPQPKKKRKKR